MMAKAGKKLLLSLQSAASNCPHCDHQWDQPTSLQNHVQHDCPCFVETARVRSALPPGRWGSYMEVGSGVLIG